MDAHRARSSSFSCCTMDRSKEYSLECFQHATRQHPSGEFQTLSKYYSYSFQTVNIYMSVAQSWHRYNEQIMLFCAVNIYLHDSKNTNYSQIIMQHSKSYPLWRSEMFLIFYTLKHLFPLVGSKSEI